MASSQRQGRLVLMVPPMGARSREDVATGACPRSLWWLLMLQGLVGLLGPGAQALEEEGGKGVRNGSHPSPSTPQTLHLPKVTQHPLSPADVLDWGGGGEGRLTHRVDAF